MKAFFTFLLISLSVTGCSLNSLAVNALADALSDGNGTAYSSDDDPEFVAEALPFGLKTMETVLESTPEHYNLLVATASGFVKYGYAFVLYPAEELEYEDFKTWQAEKKRAKNFFLRARSYGLRALSVQYPSFSLRLKENPGKALEKVNKNNVPALYWTAAAWASALSMDKSDMTLIGDLPLIEAMMQRALELDESWDNGTLHEFFIVFSASKAEASASAYKESFFHFERAMELSKGSAIAPLISLAESVMIPQQNRSEYSRLLQQAVDFDVDSFPERRLENIVAQRRASRLLINIDQYFIE